MLIASCRCDRATDREVENTPVNNPDNTVRSPSYPVMSLADAITAVGKIEGQYRASKVDREVAAKMIGYSGLSGPANKALAALAQYGLVERAGKGEMRVTHRARAILHPDSDDEKRRELRAAGLEPPLFKEMQERWPDMIPPEEGVISYFNRRGFNPTAIRPAAKAYLQTLLFLEEQRASESHGVDASGGAESAVDKTQEPIMETQPASAGKPMSLGVAAMPAVFANAEPELNAINMNIRGNKVHLEGLLDYDGLMALETKIAALKILLGAAHGDDAGGKSPN
ncbi:hypothetical protein [Sphingobium chlorophenolicum]|nr:hypothetical protein [Sphingobium chlorophenolicum]